MPFAEVKVARGRPGPERGVEVAISIRGDQGGRLIVNGMDASLVSGASVLSAIASVESFASPGFSIAYVSAQEPASGVLFFPLSAEALRCVEAREKRDTVPLTIKVRLQAQHVLRDMPPQRGLEGWTLSPQLWLQEISASVEVPLSDWVKRLAEMGWSEISLFEVPSLPLVADPNLKVALDRLRDAEARLRGGDYKGVLAKCRDAFESAAKYEAAGNTKKGFEALLERAEREDSRKREPLNGIIQALSDFAHLLGRHEQYPEIGVSRSEAELGFASTVAVFSLLGRRLGGVEG